MNNLNVVKGDTVVVLTGKDKGKKGKVIATSPKSGKVLVEEVNMQKKSVKPKNAQSVGGIVDQAGAIDLSNVMVICPKCGKATRVANQVNANGKKVRTCKKCGAELTVKVSKKNAKADDKKTKKAKAAAEETAVVTEEKVKEAPKAKTAKTTAPKKTTAKTAAKKADESAEVKE